MHRHLAMGLAALLFGCGQPRDFVGDNLGDDRAQGDLSSEVFSDPNMPQSGSTLGVGADGVMDLAMCLHDSEPGQRLFLTPTANGFSVEHEGMIGAVCAMWQVRASIDDENHEVYVDFDRTDAATCDYRCAWAFGFTMDGMASGEWTVWAGSESGTVTVP